jgi:hypothetical protein
MSHSSMWWNSNSPVAGCPPHTWNYYSDWSSEHNLASVHPPDIERWTLKEAGCNDILLPVKDNGTELVKICYALVTFYYSKCNGIPSKKLHYRSLQIYIYKNGCVCVCMYVCMFKHNSGTPGAISTKLGTHMPVCMYTNLMYILCILRREDGVGGREFGWFTLLRKSNYCCY